MFKRWDMLDWVLRQMESFTCWHPCGNFWHAGAGCLQRVMMINSHLGICFFNLVLPELLSTIIWTSINKIESFLIDASVWSYSRICFSAGHNFHWGIISVCQPKNLFDIFILLCHSVYPYRLFLHLGFFSLSTSQSETLLQYYSRWRRNWNMQWYI